MDLSLRLILSLVGVLIIISILLDGLRRLRSSDDGRKRQKRETAINSYVAPTPREKPDSDEIVGAVRVLKTEPRFSQDTVLMEEEEEEPLMEVEQKSLSLEQYVVLNVVAKKTEGFLGNQLFPIFLSAGLHFGDMGIFHRYEYLNGQGRLLFSVASLVEPGTFDIHNEENFSVPGLTFFMCLPGPSNAVSAYNLMLQTAKRVAETLNGDLRDRSKNVLTPMQIAHQQKELRQWMKEYSGAVVLSE